MTTMRVRQTMRVSMVHVRASMPATTKIRAQPIPATMVASTLHSIAMMDIRVPTIRAMMDRVAILQFPMHAQTTIPARAICAQPKMVAPTSQIQEILAMTVTAVPSATRASMEPAKV